MSDADYKKLRKTVDRWVTVMDENTAHRDLVTEHEWDAWEEFSKEWNQKLDAVINDFTGTLSQQQRTVLDDLIQQIDGARRMDEDKLIERQQEARQRAEEEERRKADEEKRKADEADRAKLLEAQKNELRKALNDRRP